MQEQESATTKHSHADLPACCGTGCPVCVLDLIEEQAIERSRLAGKFGHRAQPASRVAVAETAVCCNTGCLICVRDYPELRWQTEPDSQLLQLLEAIESAQQS